RIAAASGVWAPKVAHMTHTGAHTRQEERRADRNVTPSLLVLGGTAEARELAERLEARKIRTITSLAGRVSKPRPPAGQSRIGGFGGPDALARWLADHGIA